MDENHQDKTGNKQIATEDVRWVLNRKSKLWMPQPKKPVAERMRMRLVGKALWALIQLLLIPLVLAGVGFWFTAHQDQTSRDIAEKNRAQDLRIAADQQQETILQTYLDNMSDLLLKQNLAKSKPGDEVSQVARERTLTTLRRLEAKRNGIVLQFLQDTHLIGIQNTVIDLSYADLSHDDLSRASLFQANLRGANLSDANLSDANLIGANLRGAWLDHANLSDASLTDANLSGAVLRQATLSDAWLSGANLSDANLDKTILKGTRYNTKEITLKDKQGKIYGKIPATQWPQGFDPKAAGAIVDNTYP